jgi:NADP-dependent 3-hydroxy acid dehydrogenase YdfG
MTVDSVFDVSARTAAVRPLGRVLVTGAASGLGAATAAAIVAHGGTAIALDRALPEDATQPSVVVDLADTDAAQAAVLEVARDGIDAVVTAAGIDLPGRLSDVPADDWERVVRVNLLGTVAVVRAALPSLLARGGRIVTVASTLGHRGVSDATAYCASKFGVIGFTRALTAELKGRVGVTLLTPGGMHTAFFDERDEQYRPGPDARLCDPNDIADAIVFALTRPASCEVKELVVAHPEESSWP